ncbi:MAG: Clp protease N-terminal domain-containing protein [Micropruina sp.]|uniref:Clp protease N-terminal domain-containing protein n=1 Tax=Micropruina sp. TaxID=2737536 RepID=UPI0039E36B79
MSTLLTSRWTGAAHLEAARTRTAEIDVDHLYLGLLAVGGKAARVLGRHGVSLTSARQRVQESLADDLSALGLDGAADVLPSPRAARDLDFTEWRATGRATDLVNHAKLKDGTGAALSALIAEPSGVVRRLLLADGVDPDELTFELAAAPSEPDAVERVAADPGLLPPPAWAQRIRHYLSSPSDAVADAIADPDLLATWAYDPKQAQVSDDGETIRHSRGRKSMTLRVHHTRRREGEADVITWIHEMTDGPYAGQPLRYDRFEIRPAPGGAELVHTKGHRSFGTLGRLATALSSWFSGMGMTYGAHRIGMEIADRQPE